MYPIDLPIWASILAALVITASAIWVFVEDSSPRPLGLAGFILSWMTAVAWFTHLPSWTAILVILVGTGLFVTGMLVGRKHPEKDNFWHYSALAVGLFGKALLALAPWLFGVMSGSIDTPMWVLALLVLAAAFGVSLAVSARFREWIFRPVRRIHERAEAREAAGRSATN